MMVFRRRVLTALAAGSSTERAAGSSTAHSAGLLTPFAPGAAAVFASGCFSELLESRVLMSAAAHKVYPNIEIMHPAAAATTVDGFSPAEIHRAYGFDKINFNGIPADGRGQTIAIVDAYSNPNVAADLKVFNQQFGLPDVPSLKVVNQTGGAKLPATDSGWGAEIALDVQWAHAIAPGANILLVEASSDSVDDLMTAVNYARNTAGVSVISMSWGGTEFFSWGDGEFVGQLQYDTKFATPSGHAGVTFVAAAGDSGHFNGVQWPAASPSVLSVGGTSLYTTDTIGTYGSESAWIGTSGGISQIEKEPAYQQAVHLDGARTSPDVTYNGDPDTGFAVYDSLADGGYSGWQVIGGSSAGAPQWAALVAIANQGRTIQGLAPLDGVSQTMPILYNLYNTTDDTGASTYTDYFNDIQTTGTGPRRKFTPAKVGYDTASGLGSPHADRVVAALMDEVPVVPNGGSNGGDGGSGGGSTPSPANLPALQLFGQFTTALPASAVAGQAGSLKFRLLNNSEFRFNHLMSVTLYASTDDTISTDDKPIVVNNPLLVLKAGAAKLLKLNFTYPRNVESGAYHLIASVSATGANTAPMEVAAGTVQIDPPKIDLAAVYSNSAGVLVQPGLSQVVSVTVFNFGNVIASGPLQMSLYASTDGTLDSADPMVANFSGKGYKIKPNRGVTFKIRLTAPAEQTAGSYSLIAALTSTVQPADTNPFNDDAIIATRGS